jgi:hypothetical protein
MLGILHKQFKEYVEHTFGKEVYRSLLIRTGYTQSHAAPQRVYANNELEQLTRALAIMLNEPLDLTQEHFVAFVFPHIQEKFTLTESKPIETLVKAIPTLNLLFYSSCNDDRATIVAHCPNESTILIEYHSTLHLEGMLRGIVKLLAVRCCPEGMKATFSAVPQDQTGLYALMVQLSHFAQKQDAALPSNPVPYNPLIMKALRQQRLNVT